MPTNPAGNFAGLDPDYDLGPIKVQWSDLGSGLAAKVQVVWESRNYVWDGVSAWVRMTQPGGSGGGGTSSSFGAAFPTSGTAAGAKDNAGNMAALNLDASGQLKVVLPAGAGGLTDTELSARLNTKGQKTMAQSAPVVLASDQSAIPVTGTFWQATQPVSGTFFQATQPISAASLPLPTGAATEATLGTLLTLAGFQARINTLGQKAMAASTPVVLSSDQSAIPVTGTFWQATQPVSLAAAVDVSDRAARLLGVVASITNPVAVTGTFWQATQPVSIAAAVDVSDRAARELGRSRLWDGTDEATVVPVRTQPATTEKGLVIFDVPNRLATYATVIATQTPAITIGVKEMLAIWSAAANLKDKYIVEIWATGIVTTAATAGRSTVRVSTITSAPTGGTETGKVDISGAGASDMTNTMQVKTGGGAIGTTFIRKLSWWATQTVISREFPLFAASNPGNGIILRGGTNAGISIDIEREVAHTAIVDLWTIGIRWIEI